MLLVGFCRAQAPSRAEPDQCRALRDAQVCYDWYLAQLLLTLRWQPSTTSICSRPLVRFTLGRQLDKFKLPDLITMLFALAKLGSPVDANVAEAAAHAAGSRGITLQARRFWHMCTAWSCTPMSLALATT